MDLITTNVPEWDSPDGVSSLSVETTGYYAVQAPERGVDGGTRILCALHGWGQNSRSFLRRFSVLKTENILVVAPQAPHQFYLDLETRKVGFSWLTVYDRNRAMTGIYGLLDGVLGRVCEEYNIAGAPFMLGFSQGVSIAYRYGVLGGRPVRGYIACGGDLPVDVRTPMESMSSVNTLLVHGLEDGIVPIAKAFEAQGILGAQTGDLKTCFFEGGHEMPTEIVGRIGEWVLEQP